MIRYYISWGDGSGEWNDYMSSCQTVQLSHMWNNNGVYVVKVKKQRMNLVRKATGLHLYRLRYTVQSNKPTKPSGQSPGEKSKKHSYYTSTADPHGDRVRFDWD